MKSLILATAFVGMTTLLSFKSNNLENHNTQINLPEADVVKGLKEALVNGVNAATSNASRTDGFFKNQNIKIPFPREVQQVETRIRRMGLNKLADDFVLSMNRGAEKAAKEAAPIFVTAVRNLTIPDALGILRGQDNAATAYLQRTTTPQLTQKFKPIISTSLKSVGATKYWADITSKYNRLPGVKKVNTDLDQYVTDSAITGLFKLVATEEAAIRKDPAKQGTDILKKVFGGLK